MRRAADIVWRDLVHASQRYSVCAIIRVDHWLTVGWLHWYAPEFNDIGGCHDLKAHHMAHQTFADTDALGRAIHHAVMN